MLFSVWWYFCFLFPSIAPRSKTTHMYAQGRIHTEDARDFGLGHQARIWRTLWKSGCGLGWLHWLGQTDFIHTAITLRERRASKGNSGSSMEEPWISPRKTQGHHSESSFLKNVKSLFDYQQGRLTRSLGRELKVARSTSYHFRC